MPIWKCFSQQHLYFSREISQNAKYVHIGSWTYGEGYRDWTKAPRTPSGYPGDIEVDPLKDVTIELALPAAFDKGYLSIAEPPREPP